MSEGLHAAEEVLRELLTSERRLRSLVEATAHIVWLATPDGELVSDMPLWRELTGQTREELLGAGWLDAIHPDDRPRVDAAWTTAVATVSRYSVEYRIRRHDGGWAWLAVDGVPVLGDDGDVLEFIGQCIDVTERRDLQARLEQERALLRHVVEESPVGIVVLWGPELRYVLLNEAGKALLPPDRDVLGRPLAEAVPEVGDELRGKLAGILDDGEPLQLPDVVLDFTGPGSYRGQRFYEARAVPVPDETGAPAGVLTLTVERTDEIRRSHELEEQIARERAVADVLVSAIAADLPAEHPGWELAARLRAATDDLAVGGDWYDAIPLGDGRLALVMGDVAGRGLPAATVMGQARAVLRAALLAPGTGPAEALAQLGRFVEALPGDGMLTAVALVADPRAGTLCCARAGHPPPVVRATDGTTRVLLQGGGGPVGALGRPTTEAVVPFGAGELLLLYTDGLVERPGIDLGSAIDDVAERVARSGGSSLEALADELLAAARPVEGRYDDIALLLARST